MRKWFYVFLTVLSTYALMSYALGGSGFASIESFTIAWGVFTILTCFVEALKIFAQERMVKVVEKRVKSKIDSINKNINLTPEEKESMIQDVFMGEVQSSLDRVLKEMK